MNVATVQPVLALLASNGDESGWMQLVVFLILGVFWAVGGIMKARSEKERKRKPQKDSVRPSPAPQRPKPVSRPGVGDTRNERGIQLPRQMAQAEGAGAYREVSLKAAPSAGPADKKRPLVRPRPASTLGRAAANKQMQEPKPAGDAGITSKQGKQAFKAFRESTKPVTIGTIPPPTESLGYETPLGSAEQLRSAMVHYEIFGKCVSSREPCEQIWMR